jgi:archaellum biogenesis ATPase FlaH
MAFRLQGLEHIYQQCAKGQQQPAEDTIHSLLHDMMDRIESKYIIIDALDECTDREDLLTFICDLVNSSIKGLVIMVTSRREKDIEEQLRSITNHNINIQSTVVDNDIRVYVQDRLGIDSRLKKWPKCIQDEITDVMIENANGMYVYCFYVWYLKH